MFEIWIPVQKYNNDDIYFQCSGECGINIHLHRKMKLFTKTDVKETDKKNNNYSYRNVFFELQCTKA